MLSVGFCQWKQTGAHPTLRIMFKNVLRTSEAEILKILKNIQTQPKCRSYQNRMYRILFNLYSRFAGPAIGRSVTQD